MLNWFTIKSFHSGQINQTDSSFSFKEMFMKHSLKLSIIVDQIGGKVVKQVKALFVK